MVLLAVVDRSKSSRLQNLNDFKFWNLVKTVSRFKKIIWSRHFPSTIDIASPPSCVAKSRPKILLPKCQSCRKKIFFEIYSILVGVNTWIWLAARPALRKLCVRFFYVCCITELRVPKCAQKKNFHFLSIKCFRQCGSNLISAFIFRSFKMFCIDWVHFCGWENFVVRKCFMEERDNLECAIEKYWSFELFSVVKFSLTYFRVIEFILKSIN